jgi:predicted nuclease of predicted toxin-antitoxin system
VSVRVKVDEDLPRQIAGMMAAQGHDAVTVAAQGWQGAHDDDLWPRVQSEQRWLITADKGFADLRRHQPPGTHAGIILLRAPEENRRAYLELAAIALERLKLDEIPGAVVVATPGGIRIRRAPAHK